MISYSDLFAILFGELSNKRSEGRREKHPSQS